MQSNKKGNAAAERRGPERRDPNPQNTEAAGSGGDNRRQPGDRRDLPFGVLYSTSESIVFMEDWLDDNCKGRWKVSLEEMDEDLVRKSIRIEFEQIGDKQAFIERFSPH
jgi:hypothetical protein